MLSINYELAKKLKDAGFPQKDKDYYCAKHDHYLNLLPKPDCTVDAISFPTLSELIEACGDGFAQLLKGYNHPTWYACNVTEIKDVMIEGRGSTPEEAVTNLWLTLNKK